MYAQVVLVAFFLSQSKKIWVVKLEPDPTWQ